MIKPPKFKNKRSTKKIKSIAVLTSGGDAPGMNAAIRAVVRYGLHAKLHVYGILRGYRGLLEGQLVSLDRSSVANIVQRGGTILKTSRCESFFKRSVRREAAHLLVRKRIDALVVIGGDGSFAGAHALERETGFPVIGIPGTIDNDIPGTDDTVGFDTAVNTAIEAIDRIRDTANSHDRLFLVEVMGRNSGFIAAQVAIGGGAETIVIPQLGPQNGLSPSTVETICQNVNQGMRRGKLSSIIIVAEGPKPGLTLELAKKLEKRGYSPRACILGHIQRGGVPTGHDRFLASHLGAYSVEALLRGYSNCMVGVSENQVTFTPLKEVIRKQKPMSRETLQLAEILAT